MTAILGFIPAYKNVLTGTTLLATHALSQALRLKGIDWGVSSISNPDIAWVRNFALTHWYYHLPHYSHILFIDDDMGFMPDAVLDMLAFGEPVLGAIYPKKTMERQWAVSGLPTPQQKGPFIEVEGLGCGCFMIRRDAIDIMIQKMPELVDTRPNTLDSDLFREIGMKKFLRPFDMIDDPRRGTVSEDISFGRRWRMCGGKVWGAMHHEMVHVGPYEFRDTYQVWAQTEKVKGEAVLEKRIADAPILKDNPVLKGKRAKHGAFIYNPNDTFIGRSIEAYGEWAEFEVDFLKNFIESEDTVIDVGANIGTHTVPFSRLVGNMGKVFALEAYPRIFNILEANVRLNLLKNVYWENRVVGADCEPLKFVDDIPTDDTVCNFGNFSLKGDGALSPGKITVDMITVDSFALDDNIQNISLIKIDVEGMEADVIQGAKETIKKHKPALYLDFGDDGDGPAVWEALQAIDYVAFWHFGPFYHPGNFAQNHTNIWPGYNVLAANLVAFPADAERNPLTLGMPQFAGPDDTWKKGMERMAAAHVAQAAE